MENIDWNQKIKEALDRTEFMALSTIDSESSWTNPVAFAYSEKLELFWISMMDAKHSQNIITDPQVSVAIFKTERFPTGDVMGLQIRGNAHHLTNQDEIERAAKYYFGRSNKNDDFKEKTSERGGMDAKWQFFKIKPSEVWCFDSRVFGEERRVVNIEELNIDVN